MDEFVELVLNDENKELQYVELFEATIATGASTRGIVKLCDEYAIKRLGNGKISSEVKSFNMMARIIEECSNICATPVCRFIFNNCDDQVLGYFVYRNHGCCVAENFDSNIGVRMLESFEKLSSLGIVHGDIRHENILWDGTNIVLIDFEHSERMDNENAAKKNGNALALVCHHFGPQVIELLIRGNFVEARSVLSSL